MGRKLLSSGTGTEKEIDHISIGTSIVRGIRIKKEYVGLREVLTEDKYKKIIPIAIHETESLEAPQP